MKLLLHTNAPAGGPERSSCRCCSCRCPAAVSRAATSRHRARRRPKALQVKGVCLGAAALRVAAHAHQRVGLVRRVGGRGRQEGVEQGSMHGFPPHGTSDGCQLTSQANRTVLS